MSFCWLTYSEQEKLRELLKYEVDNEIEKMRARIMETERDNKMLRAEIESLQRMRHTELRKALK